MYHAAAACRRPCVVIFQGFGSEGHRTERRDCQVRGHWDPARKLHRQPKRIRSNDYRSREFRATVRRSCGDQTPLRRKQYSRFHHQTPPQRLFGSLIRAKRKANDYVEHMSRDVPDGIGHGAWPRPIRPGLLAYARVYISSPRARVLKQILHYCGIVARPHDDLRSFTEGRPAQGRLRRDL